MTEAFPVLFSGTADHPLTSDWVRRGGVFESSAQRVAMNRLFRTLDGITTQSTLYGTLYIGGLDGCLIPQWNRGGAVGALTNNGFVAGDYGATTGLAQSGSKRLTSPITAGSLGLTGSWVATYHSGNTSASRVLAGAPSVFSFEYRGVSTADAGGFWNNSAALRVQGAATATAAARLAFVSNGSADLRLFRDGAQDGATQTGARSAPTGVALIEFGTYSSGSGALATQTAVIHSTAALTLAQITAMHAALRDFFVAIGRPSCDSA